MFLFFATLSSSAFYLQHEEKSFLSWMRTTNQYYTGDEYHFRFGVFLTHSRYVKEHNKHNCKYTLSLNKFSTYTSTEYRTLLNSQATRYPQKRNSKESTQNNKDSFDWRDKNVVNPIEDMGRCTADWAFSAVQSMETVYAISSGQLKKFSEQQLVDCVTSCSGCKGGDSNAAFQSIIDNGGFVCLQSDYEYTASQNACKFDDVTHVGPVISKYIDVPDGNEVDMAVKIELYGPAVAVIDASNASFQLYDSGIYDEPSCDPYILSLTVGVVGFGVEDEVKYWIVRNAWGSSWGENGYIRMLRENNNQCGIASWASVVTL